MLGVTSKAYCAEIYICKNPDRQRPLYRENERARASSACMQGAPDLYDLGRRLPGDPGHGDAEDGPAEYRDQPGPED